MDTIDRYQIRIPGHQPSRQRATIQLLGAGAARSIVGRVHFYDDVQAIPDDSVDDGVVEMHMPTAALGGVIAMLQHDRPIKLDFRDGRGQLWNGEWERVGETELLR